MCERPSSNVVTGTWRVRCGVVWFVGIPLRDAGGGASSQGYVGGILRLTGATLPKVVSWSAPFIAKPP